MKIVVIGFAGCGIVADSGGGVANALDLSGGKGERIARRRRPRTLDE